MFWITLGLALAIFGVALELRRQAQGEKERARTLEVRQHLNFEWLKARLPGHQKNMRPTIAVDYRKAQGEIAAAAGADWSDDIIKTQVLTDQDSGFRLKQR